MKQNTARKSVKPKIRLVKERTQQMRDDERALIEKYKQENERLRRKNTSLLVPKAEEMLWYGSMILGLSVIFGWHIVLTS